MPVTARGRHALFLLFALALTAAGSAPAASQVTQVTGPTRTTFPAPFRAHVVDPVSKQEGPSPSLAPVLASAILPGLGQRIQGQRRWVAYMALEAAAIVYHFERSGRGGALRTDYRDLAWETARIGTSEPRMDGDFDYYERLSNFSSSGLFDVDAGTSGIQPEPRTDTYNGRIWGLARGLFLGGNTDPRPGDPGWDDAIAYYNERGYDDAFLWDWSGRDQELGTYRSTLRDSDAAFRRATTVLGVIIGNHIVSMVDALLSSSGQVANRVDVDVVPGVRSSGVRGPSWDLSIQVRR